MNILVIDTETGGLDSEKHSILTIAGVCLDTDKGTVTPLFDLLIREATLSVDKQAMEVNKIDLNVVVKDGLSPADAVTQIVEKLQNNFPIGKQILLAGHNVGFDVAFMKRLFRLSGTTHDFGKMFSHRVLDSASLIQYLQLVGIAEAGSPNLDMLLKVAEVPYETNMRHTAIGDARLTAQAISNLIVWMKGILDD